MSETGMGAADRRLQKAIDYARHDFDKHEITRVRFGVWKCATPGTLINHFYVVWSPGALIVHGDIGELIFTPRKPNALRWAKGVCRPAYIDYPLEKLSSQIKAEEYVSEIARENVSYWISEEEDPKIKKDMEEDWELVDSDDSAQYWDYVHRYVEDVEKGDLALWWTNRTLIVYQALCWFMQHVSANDDRFKEELAS